MNDVQSIRQALAILNHSSIRKAAAELNLQPSAVSRRLRSLEDELGVTLFERGRAGVQPTFAGRIFLRRARGALAELDEAARSAAIGQKGEIGALAITFYPSLASGVLHHILAEHRARWPMLEYTFREGSSADQLIAIHQHKADVAFLMAVADAPGAVSEHLWDERVYVAAPAAHPKAARDALTWADLRDEAFMVRAYDSGPIVYAWLAGKLDPGGYAPKIRQQDVCRDSMLGLVSAGHALTVVAESAIGIVIPGVVYRPIVDDDATVSVRMAWLDGNENPTLGPFLSHARRIARRTQRAP